MDKIKSNLVITEGLIQKIINLPASLDGSGVLMCFGQGKSVPKINDPELTVDLERIITEIVSIRKIDSLFLMLNRLPSKVTVPIHRDYLPPTKHQKFHPILERWHLPLVTNDLAWYWDEMEGFNHMPMGFWYGPIPYWMRHQIGNNGDTERIHLIVDLDTPEPIGKYMD